jgi:hypothetical protein
MHSARCRFPPAPPVVSSFFSPSSPTPTFFLRFPPPGSRTFSLPQCRLHRCPPIRHRPHPSPYHRRRSLLAARSWAPGVDPAPSRAPVPFSGAALPWFLSVASLPLLSPLSSSGTFRLAPCRRSRPPTPLPPPSYCSAARS